jgi:hypothetical protein
MQENTQQSSKSYSLIWSVVVVALLGGIGAFNLIIDPYGLYGIARLKGLNDRKPEIKKHIRMHKAAAVMKVEPQSIAVGNSRVEYGIDPNHPAWKFKPAYNLGLVSANAYEMLRYLQHAQAAQPLKQVLVGLDIDSFNALQSNEADFDEARLAMTASGESNFARGADFFKSLFSFDALVASYETITMPPLSDKAVYLYRENGQREVDYSEHNIQVRGGHHQAFLKSEQYFAEEGYLAGAKGKFGFVNPSTKVSSFDWFRSILRFAYGNGIELRLFISPSHARQWEVADAMGLWDEFEQWKVKLVEVVEEEARSAGKPPVPLWDFSGYNRYTAEEVPPLGDTASKMQWYIESSHYNHRLGGLVLAKVYEESPRDEAALQGFGVLLTSSNVQAHLEQIRKDRELYRTLHPKDVEEVRAVVAKFAPKGVREARDAVADSATGL